ncbi:hypothetical protein G4B88_022461 [Cannabis sativa]|uniref:beta-ketoacyl-[acyl-carrier-protein] synthase I n=1 Tax=Cannabis sativa TaxID=3483 RepID=A0A7J6HXE2_CANSA|nr:hypothetical protein G4B88_022461 [Cannabis sativa]
MEVSSIASPPYTCFAVQSQNRLIISQRAQRKKLIIPTCCINGNGAISASKNTHSCAFDQHNIEYYTSRGLYATLPVFGDNTSLPIYGSKSAVSITGRKKTRLMSCEAHSTDKATCTTVEADSKEKTRKRRVVVTGLGVISSIGHDPNAFYTNLLEGVSGISEIEGFDCSEFPSVSTEAVEALRVSYRKINPFTVPFATANMGSAILAIDLGWTGPNYSISTACATSNFCILNAAQHIISDDADMMLCGGSDAGVIPISIGGFISCRLLSRQNDEPTKASRPWDTNRDGFVMGEGAGVLLLEELEHAKKRGATIYAELLGGSFTCNAFRTDDSGKEISLCMERALAQSGVAPEDVNYINAHAISSPASDIKEIRAINRCFGKNPNLRVNSTKSMIGHLLGAAGAVEAVATVKAIQTGLVHPNINLDNPDEGVYGNECGQDMNVLVGKKKERLDIKVALSNSLAFGGQNSSLVFAPYYNSRGLYAPLAVIGENISFPICGSKSNSFITRRRKSRFMNCEAHSADKATCATVEADSKKETRKRRVVVTGLGVVSSIGHDPNAFYTNLLEGVSGISEIEGFDCSEFPSRIAGQIKSFSTEEEYVSPKISKRADKFMLYMLTAGKKALIDSGITSQKMGELDKARCGVLIGSALGGISVFTEANEALRSSYRKINPFTVPFTGTNMGPAILAIDLGWTGPNYSISAACATSNSCILNAAHHITSGDADMMLCGGSESAIVPISIGGFIACKLLSRQNDEPTKASRPWDTTRDGFVMGEGAGVLLLEELEHAKRRGATIYAEFLGGSLTCDALRYDESGREISLCMENALAQSGVAPEDVNYINAHAISSPTSDMEEIRAINRCFGKNPNLRVNSTKSMIGHLLGAAGAVEAVATVKAIQTGMVHPNINLDNFDEGTGMNALVGKKKERLDIKVALSNSLAFGGQNSSLVFAPYK